MKATTEVLSIIFLVISILTINYCSAENVKSLAELREQKLNEILRYVDTLIMVSKQGDGKLATRLERWKQNVLTQSLLKACVRCFRDKLVSY